MKVGVLALQGAFAEHAGILKTLGIETVEVRLPEHLSGLSGLIIPGGESTTIGKLAVEYHLIEALRCFAAKNPVWGICAGLILLAKEADTEQPLLGVMDIVVQRNAFGRQVDSFETEIPIKALEDGRKRLFPAVFIRAPSIVSVKEDVQVMARLNNGTIVAVQQKKSLGTVFHPELTRDFRFHQYFLSLIIDNG